ncbi:NDR1/HIN1-like protein 10 [Corylus avellana]|uniref:NDR1/HIN1-like protein 10 n=1 Tax=Corylus avellana TaxID=13451 RepID=UPI001E1EBE13|nr:NDR1/HIN1-like protein 10 [Corylus avellana]
MGEKQPHLNGSFYGPSVPPPSRSYRSRGDDCCLFDFLFQLIGSVAVVAGLAVLVFWLIFHPSRVKFHVTDASLITQFNFTTTTTNNNMLYYNLYLNVTIRNPNEKIGIYYDRIEANAFYVGQRFSTEALAPFYQGHKNTTVLSPAFKGQQLVLLGSNELSVLDSEKSLGVFDIHVKFYLWIRFRLGNVNTCRIKPNINCDLKVPLTSNGNSTAVFEITKCDIGF